MFFLGADGQYRLEYSNEVFNPETRQMDTKTGSYDLVVKESRWTVEAEGQAFSGFIIKKSRGDWYFITDEGQAMFKLNAFGLGEVAFGFTTIRAINKAGIAVNSGGAFSPSRPF